jgi:hypothetical protein
MRLSPLGTSVTVGLLYLYEPHTLKLPSLIPTAAINLKIIVRSVNTVTTNHMTTEVDPRYETLCILVIQLYQKVNSAQLSMVIMNKL